MLMTPRFDMLLRQGLRECRCPRTTPAARAHLAATTSPHCRTLTVSVAAVDVVRVVRCLTVARFAVK